MAFRDLTDEEIDALVGTRHAVTGIEFPPNGLQPYYRWLIRTLYRLSEAAAGGLRVERDDASLTSVRIAPGRASLFDTTLEYTGGVFDLAPFNDNIALIWIEDGGGDATIGGAAASEGWPSTPHVRLAEVVVEGGSVVELRDRRADSMLSAVSHAGRVPPITDLMQTISSPPTQAQVQAIQETLNDLLEGLRSAGYLTT
ncbi:MAG: hypothetical protein K8S99_06520 [Planctomycetes bacterium]|nr:hypothetical protein [Planctomycetota bacterium]